MIKNVLNNKKGISIIIVTVIAFILLIVGGVVMSFAANNLMDSNVSTYEKNSYYVGKSMINTMTKMIVDGDVGNKLIKEGYSKVNSTSKLYYETPKNSTETATVNIAMTGDKLAGYKVNMDPLKYRIKAMRGETVNGRAIISLNLDDIIISFRMNQGEDDERYFKVKYYYVGTITEEGGRISWDGKWTVSGTEE
ncbi:MAG: hypothetical protein RR495_02410 [Anaerovoracaceae bacterium]